ncbi:alpha/beta fold hydrolase [Fulvivirga lutimaris]|uniref:alpha/beta fold hydrolase n=1 Tax=Fulvivirga lutimaris TaxID=1819566 RepID=UPI0012BBF8AB|nr:alpha/beta hydrolase [Fulvivirga lutimaris]MTI38248.1 alpha/beta hydrolase [Fulvivirga lutimaris]
MPGRLSNKVKFGISILAVVLTFQLTSGCFSFRMTPKEVDKYFKSAELKPTLDSYEVNKRKVNFAAIGSDSLPTVIFFHGAPGSWSAFISFLANPNLNTRSKIVSVDRPGYGYSNFGNSEPSLQKQSELLKPLLEKYSDTPNILVGHSLGGPVIAKLAMLYPELVDGLILVAPSIDPDLEPDETWFRLPLHTPFLRWVLPVSLRVTNDEIYFLKDELELMLPDWSKINAPVIVIQGMKDKLVPPGNADFAKEQLTNAKVKLMLIEDMNHFIPWSNPELIEGAINEQLKVIKEKGEE